MVGNGGLAWWAMGDWHGLMGIGMVCGRILGEWHCLCGNGILSVYDLYGILGIGIGYG
jgi:hypothetical protein